MRLVAVIAFAITLLGIRASDPIAAQQPATGAVDSAAAWSHPKHSKSPPVAALLGLMLPGSAHWYVEEYGRALTVAAVYWTSVIIVKDGRTDTVGKVGGLAFVGAVAFSVIDGVRGTDRYNARLSASIAPTSRGVQGVMRLTIPPSRNDRRVSAR